MLCFIRYYILFLLVVLGVIVWYLDLCFLLRLLWVVVYLCWVGDVSVVGMVLCVMGGF